MIECENMTISDRIFERLQQLSISQKEFAGKAGIQQSTISEWKKNKTGRWTLDVGRWTLDVGETLVKRW